MNELNEKINKFDEKSGLKLYEEIKNDLFKISNRLIEARTSRDLWKKKYMDLKKPESNGLPFTKEDYKKIMDQDSSKTGNKK